MRQSRRQLLATVLMVSICPTSKMLKGFLINFMRIFTSSLQLFLIVLGWHIHNANSIEFHRSSLTTSGNDFDSGKTNFDKKEGIPDLTNNDRNGDQTAVSQTFVRNLNQALMKFLRDVTQMVKNSPHDAEHLQQADVERIIARTLLAAVSERSSSATSTSSTVFPIKAPLTTTRPAFFKNTVQRRLPPNDSSSEFVPKIAEAVPREELHVGHTIRNLRPQPSQQSQVHKSAETWAKVRPRAGLEPTSPADQAGALPTASNPSPFHRRNSPFKRVLYSTKDSPIQNEGEKGSMRMLNPTPGTKPFRLRHISRRKPQIPISELSRSIQTSNGTQIQVIPAQIKEKQLGEGTTSTLKRRKAVKQPFLRNESQIEVVPARRPLKRFGETKPWRTPIRGNFRGSQTTNFNTQHFPIGQARPGRGQVILQQRGSFDVRETISRQQNRQPQQRQRLSVASKPVLVRGGKGTEKSAWSRRALPPKPHQRSRGLPKPAPFPISLQRPLNPGVNASLHPVTRQRTDQVIVPRAGQRPRTDASVGKQVTRNFRSSPAPSTSTATPTSPPPTSVTDPAVRQNSSSATRRERVLNNMLFDVFSRMGVLSFVMKSDEESLRGIADPSRTHFSLDKVVDRSILDEQSSQAPPPSPANSSNRLHHFEEEEDLQVVVSAAQRKPSRNSRSQRPPFAGQRFAVRNPTFFRDDGNGKWTRTSGPTRKQLRMAATKNT